MFTWGQIEEEKTPSKKLMLKNGKCLILGQKYTLNRVAQEIYCASQVLICKFWQMYDVHFK